MSQDFKNQFKSEIEELGNQLVEFPWQNKEAYSQWLGQTYHFVTRSTRMLALASALMPQDYQSSHLRFIDHAHEEKGHEFLLLKDLKSLGYKISDIVETSTTSSFYQSQYYRIQHVHPAALYGWVIVLEALAAYYGPQLYESIKASHGEKASNFIRVHANEDPEHIESAFGEVARLGNSCIDVITENFFFSKELYSQMLNQAATKAVRDIKTAA